MEEKFNTIEPLLERVEEYGKTTCQLIKLEVADKTSTTVSFLASGAIVWLILTLSLLSISVGLSLLIGELFGRNSIGFFCVAGAYLLLLIIYYYLLRKSFKSRINNYVISHILN